MNSNEIIIYKGRGRKTTYSNINKVSISNNKVYLDNTLVANIPKRFNIRLNGMVGNVIAPLIEDNSLKIKRIIGGSGVYDMSIDGNISELSFKDNNSFIGVYVENSYDFESSLLNTGESDADSFIKFIVNMSNIYEGVSKKISKDSQLKDISKDIEDMLDLALKANKTFTSCNFAPSLNTIISNLNSIISKCKTNPSKKVKNFYFSNILLKYHINKVYNSRNFRQIMGSIVVD